MICPKITSPSSEISHFPNLEQTVNLDFLESMTKIEYLNIMESNLENKIESLSSNLSSSRLGQKKIIKLLACSCSAKSEVLSRQIQNNEEKAIILFFFNFAHN
jgi:predicted XRE-type DNA-binding protein